MHYQKIMAMIRTLASRVDEPAIRTQLETIVRTATDALRGQPVQPQSVTREELYAEYEETKEKEHAPTTNVGRPKLPRSQEPTQGCIDEERAEDKIEDDFQ